MVAVKLYVEHRTKFCLCSDNRGQSPIHVAVKSGNLAVAEYLHSMGSPIDGSDIMGSQPIHKACANKEKPEAARRKAPEQSEEAAGVKRPKRRPR